jgi:ATP-dependent DNA helicase RecG
MHKLGPARDIDLALHLPMRYEDETRCAPSPQPATARPRRCRAWCANAASSNAAGASCWCGWPTTAASLVLRFLNFYPSHQKTLAVGQRVRARGEVRGGFFGREMVHPTFKAVDAPTRRCRRR